MTKAQAAAERAAKRMYRGIITAQAVADVFVRATSDTAANAAIEAGKGQRMKPHFGKWQVWQEPIAVSTYEASDIPPPAITRIARGLNEQELGKSYVEVLRNISVIHRAVRTDGERQAMADAVNEFYDLLTEAIRPKAPR